MRRATALVGVLVLANVGLVGVKTDAVAVTPRSCIYNAGRHNTEVVPATGPSAQGIEMSGDGSKIVYVDTTNGEQVRVRDRATGLVADAPAGVDRNAVWSGDLRYVALLRTNGANRELFVVDRSTATEKLLVSLPSSSLPVATGVSDGGVAVTFTVVEGLVRVVKQVDYATTTVTTVSANDGAGYDGLSVSANGRYVVALRNSTQVWLYDVQTPSATLVGAGVNGLVNADGTVVTWSPSFGGALHVFDIAGAADSTPTVVGTLAGRFSSVPSDMSADGRYLLMTGAPSGVPTGSMWMPMVLDRVTGSFEPFGVGFQSQMEGAAISDDGNRVLTGGAFLSTPAYGSVQAYVVDRGATMVDGSAGADSGRPGVVTLSGNFLPTSLAGIAVPPGIAFGRFATSGARSITLAVDSWWSGDRLVRLTLTGPTGCRVSVPALDLIAPAGNFISPAVVHPGQRLNVNGYERTLGPPLVGIDAGTGLTFTRHDTNTGNFDVVAAATAPGGVRTATLHFDSASDLVVPDALRVRSTAGEYHSVTAAQLTKRVLTGGIAQSVAVAGRLGVPATGVQSVVLNVTVTTPTVAGSVFVYPAGAARPGALTAAYSPTRFSSNMVIAKLGAGGAVNLFVSAGRAAVTVDVVGWFSVLGSTNRTGLAIDPQPPVRAYDSRQHGARPAANSTRTLTPDLGSGVAALASVTVISPAADGALVLRPANTPNSVSPQSGPATIRFRAGQTVTNLAIVPLGLGQLEVATSASTHYVIDILGVVQPQTTTDGELVRSVTPVRALLSTPLAAGGQRTVRVVGVGGVPANAKSVIVNLTSTNTVVSGSVVAWASNWTRPSAPNLNTARGSTVSNLAVVPIGADGRIAVYSSTATNLILDIVGFTVSG